MSWPARHDGRGSGNGLVIGVRLDGGLGNQLFQYAAGRALALRHGVNLLVDDSSLRRPRRGATPREPELQHFRPVARFASVPVVHWSPLTRRVPQLSRWLGPWSVF